MINHVSIGVRDLGKSGRFYDAALAPLGYQLSSIAPKPSVTGRACG